MCETARHATYVQGKGKVRVKAHQQHEERRYEIVYGRHSLARWKRVRYDADNRRERAADVRTENHGTRILDRQLCRHAEYCVLIDTVGHWKNRLCAHSDHPIKSLLTV